MTNEKPKTTTKVFQVSDFPKGAFSAETIPGSKRELTYKPVTRHYGYYNRISTTTERRITFGPDQDTIQATINSFLSIQELDSYLKWVEGNCLWHKTVITYASPKRVELKGHSLSTTTRPIPKFEGAYVDSTCLRTMTDKMKKDLAAAEANRTKRQAEKRKKDAAAQAERRKQTAARKKKEAVVEEFGDLASALHVLKKHGLKIVTVDEAKPKPKKKG